MSAKGYENQSFVEEAHAKVTDTEKERRESIEELHETRERLEGPDVTDLDAVEGRSSYAMTEDRRIGTLVLSVDADGPSYEFGKPSGRATRALIAPIVEMEESEASIEELSDFVWVLLGEWSLDGHGYDYWADEVGLADAVTLARAVAMGGNDRTLAR